MIDPLLLWSGFHPHPCCWFNDIQRECELLNRRGTFTDILSDPKSIKNSYQSQAALIPQNQPKMENVSSLPPAISFFWNYITKFTELNIKRLVAVQFC